MKERRYEGTKGSRNEDMNEQRDQGTKIWRNKDMKERRYEGTKGWRNKGTEEWRKEGGERTSFHGINSWRTDHSDDKRWIRQRWCVARIALRVTRLHSKALMWRIRVIICVRTVWRDATVHTYRQTDVSFRIIGKERKAKNKQRTQRLWEIRSGAQGAKRETRKVSLYLSFETKILRTLPQHHIRMREDAMISVSSSLKSWSIHCATSVDSLVYSEILLRHIQGIQIITICFPWRVSQLQALTLWVVLKLNIVYPDYTYT